MSINTNRPKSDQPVRVLLQYTGWRVVERWIELPNIQAYHDKFLTRYHPFVWRHEMPKLRRRFHILKVTWDGKDD